jgi:propanol-preferring alcohol dehydrogenase
MLKTMRTAAARALGTQLAIEELPVPTPGPREVVKVVASGLCETDLHAADGNWPVKPTSSFVPGDEGAGSTEAENV